MPIYEYRCSSCGFQKEYLQKVSDPLHSVCPECGKPSLGKMLTAAGFHLKGGGWYATDFKNSGAAPAAKGAGESGGESKGASAGEGKAAAAGQNKNGGEGKSEGKGKAEAPPPAAAPAPASSVKAE